MQELMNEGRKRKIKRGKKILEREKELRNNMRKKEKWKKIREINKLEDKESTTESQIEKYVPQHHSTL